MTGRAIRNNGFLNPDKWCKSTRNIQDVNDRAVIKEEQLSNQVYLYRRDKDCLMVA